MSQTLPLIEREVADMTCLRPLTHIVVHGDTLYQLSRHYRTTIPAILQQNPRLNPYNLHIGTRLLICPGEGFPMEETTRPSVPMDSALQLALINDMRLAWSQHVYWTRLLLISIAERLQDETDVASRLLENPYDIAAIFGKYYPQPATKQIASLLTDHLQIGAKLITALRDKEIAQADALSHDWYHNAEQMSAAFHALNPQYSYDVLHEMFDTHLALTTREVNMRLARDYPADINAFNQVEREALQMADYFSYGLMRAFPQKFS